MLAFTALIALELVAILALTEGHFVYSLDDPYIHLALAESIWRGEYGINAGESSSPSSSLLWPLLLAPFQGGPFGRFVPLLYALLAGAGSIVVLQRLARRVVEPTTRSGEWLQAACVLYVALCGNVIALVFTGMEHSLQIFMALLLLDGAIASQQRVPGHALLALAVAPWVRYECLGLSLAFGLYFTGKRARWQVVGSLLVCAAVLGAFSYFLSTRTGELLPYSVLTRLGSPSVSFLARLMKRSAVIATDPQAAAIALLCAILLWLAVRAPNVQKRRLARTLAIATLAHLAFGRFGAFRRYEAYIWMVDVVGLLWMTCEGRTRYRARELIGGACILGLLSALIAVKAFVTPLGARDIYRQQFQMARFASDFYRRPVAVNDLGYVAYRHDSYVLDLVGLASHDAFKMRSRALVTGPEWMATLCRKHAVGLAMVYRQWFRRFPDDWIELGTLSMATRTSAARAQVAFFATSDGAARELIPLLERFAKTLPRGVEFHWAAGPAKVRSHEPSTRTFEP